MNKNYLTSNNKKAKSLNPRQVFLSIILLLTVSFTFAQSELTITTTYSDGKSIGGLDWTMSISNPLTPPIWTANGPGVNLTTPFPTNTPVFDLSASTGLVTVQATGTPSVFNKIESLSAMNPIGLEITTIDVSDLKNIESLYLGDNLLTSIDVTNNKKLKTIGLSRNDLNTLDISQNKDLEFLFLDANQNLSSLDISQNTKLKWLTAQALLNLTSLDISNNPNLVHLNLEFTSLTSTAIDDILNKLDAFGNTGGYLNLQNTGGVITKAGIAAYINLKYNKGWEIYPPQSFDFGDAPESYQTTINGNGPIHLIGIIEDLRIGQKNDKEEDGFPGIDADGDDNDPDPAENDEDGVDPTEFNNILTSATNITINLQILNNYTDNSYLHAWIDLDGNGTFDTDEYATLVLEPNTGVQNHDISWDITALGADIIEGQTYARFRLTKDNDMTASDVGGYSTGGEVEDYTLTIGADFDKDGIPDESDLDADNDGILDSVEGDGSVDTDGDGSPDNLDLDADGDGCYDVLEAGFVDGDGDGELGSAPLTIDANGQITDQGGYTTPADADNNGTYDFQEAGAAATITTEPTDQDLIIGVSTFSVVATADTYQWEESQDGGTTWIPLVDGGDYAGTDTADLQVTNSDVSKLTYRYHVIVNNIAYVCDPTTTSVDVGYITPDDFDGDGVYDIVDADSDNDGIEDAVEGDDSIDTDGDGSPDNKDLDADGDGCFDVTEAGFTDGDNDGELGSAPVTVDTNGQVTSGSDGYTTPNDLDNNGIPDFQEAGAAATITTEPTDQNLILGVSTFTVVAAADTYQWQEDKQDGSGFVDIVDGGDYSGATTADLQVTNSDVSKLTYRYRVIVSNIAYACDPTTTSVDVGYITPDDFDGDGVHDIVDVDDDNDGILDTVEENGVADRDTDGDGSPDRMDLDADGDGCFDVIEAGFTDDNGDGRLGDLPLTVDPDGSVNSGVDGYTTPNDLNSNGTPDYQESGVAANITTQPSDQVFVLAGSSTFSVATDLAAGDESYQWEESTDNGVTWNALTDGGDYSGVTTADLTVSTPDFTKVNFRYRVLVSNIAYACDPVTPSTDATFINPGDFDKDTIFDVVDVDDDNDGILDVDEDNGVTDRDTDGDGNPDRIDLDADGDGCNDVTEAGFTDDNGDGELGDFPVAVDANGQVTSGSDGYTPPNDLDLSGTPDFQEAGAAASITTEPTDQPLLIGTTTFSVVAAADTYQWEESTDGGTTWATLVDGGDYAGATTADLMVTNNDVSKSNYKYRVIASNIAYACDPSITSAEVGYFAPDDFDLDGVYDIVDLDDDNDGILDTVEDNGIVDRDTDGDGSPDRIDLDADGDGCSDVTEAGFENNGADMLGNQNPPTVDLNGQVTSATDGYTAPADADGNGTPDFQEAGEAAAITAEPTDQDLFPTQSATFSVTATADTYQWEESTDGGTTWTPITDGGNFSGATTASLTISNLDVAMRDNLYRVNVNNIAYACDPVTTSATAGFISLLDTDGDNVPDLADLDDDNDGILDADEGDGTVDTDGDGTPDSLSLDADGDGCSDVTEAGFENNGADMLGNQNPPTVDANGQVTSATDGYTTPNDLNNNSIYDFQEAGEVAVLTEQPVAQDFVLDGSATYSVTATTEAYQWEESQDDGATWTPLTEGGNYSGVNTADLTVSNLTIDMYFYDYRVMVKNVSYACDEGTYSESITYNELADTDNDTIFDIIDDDDDNDGIEDIVEGDGDTDGDGTPDRIDLDSDGDDCPDVTEAGFTNNGADMLGTANPPTVDDAGKVTSADNGYTTPNDLDDNGTFDFQQAGSPSEITTQPSDVEVALGDDTTFTVVGNATYYQWQVSSDNGSTWSDIEDSDQYSGSKSSQLTVHEARGRVESSLYRVMMTSPDYACDPNPDGLFSEAAMLSFNTEIIPNGFSPNGDGENDLFIIPGLDQYPNFKMEVFDRWGNSVYKYDNNGSTDPQWWDGNADGSMVLSDGERVPAGTYFYMIDFNDGSTAPVKGWVYVNY